MILVATGLLREARILAGPGLEVIAGGGFPRVFYLRYHGYPKFFPLWALARYRNLKRGNARSVLHGL